MVALMDVKTVAVKDLLKVEKMVAMRVVLKVGEWVEQMVALMVPTWVDDLVEMKAVERAGLRVGLKAGLWAVWKDTRMVAMTAEKWVEVMVEW